MVVSFCIRIVMIVKRRRESMRKQMKKNVGTLKEKIAKRNRVTKKQ